MVSMASRTGREFQRYDEGLRQVVGCIPYRYRKTNQLPSVGGTLVDELEVLLISSQKSQRMMFPKGGWEIDECIEEAAKRETIEEAGVDGNVEPKLGVWKFKSRSQDIFHEGHMFPLLVKEQLDLWPEKDVRQRTWVSVNEARELCDHLWMKEALDIFVGRLMQDNGKPLTRKEPRVGGIVPQKQQKVEENTRHCSLESLGTEEPIRSIVAQKEEEENRRSCLLEFLRKPRIGIVIKMEKKIMVALFVAGKSTSTWRLFTSNNKKSYLPKKKKQQKELLGNTKDVLRKIECEDVHNIIQLDSFIHRNLVIYFFLMLVFKGHAC